MGASVSVESHLSVRDVYLYTSQTGLSIAEVEFLWRRFRGLRIAEISAALAKESGAAAASPPGSPQPPPGKPAKGGGRAKAAAANAAATKEEPTPAPAPASPTSPTSPTSPAPAPPPATAKRDVFLDDELGAPIYASQLRVDWLLERVHRHLLPPGRATTFADFLTLVVEWRRRSLAQQLQTYYKILDVDGDGTVSIGDVVSFIQNVSCHQLAVGDRVRTRSDGRVGTVRHHGETKFYPGITWVGLELDEPTGKNNGTVEGERYFVTKPLHGLFVQENNVDLVAHHNMASDIMGQMTGVDGAQTASQNQFVNALASDTYLAELLAKKINFFQ